MGASRSFLVELFPKRLSRWADCLGNEVALSGPSSLSFSLLRFFSGPLKGSVLGHTFLCDSGKSVTHSGPCFTPSLKREGSEA